MSFVDRSPNLGAARHLFLGRRHVEESRNLYGPEFGTVQRADLVEAAKEAAESGFDVLVSCAFSYEARTTDFTKLGRIPVLIKCRIP